MSKQIVSTYKRGEIWWYSFTTPNKQRIRKSAKTTNQQEAKELAALEYNSCWRNEKLGDVSFHTWQEAVLLWLNEKPERKENRNMLYGLRWLDQYLGKTKLIDINKYLIDEIKKTKQISGVKNRTVNAVLQQIRVVLKCAYEHGLLDKIPPIKLLKEPTRRIRWLTEYEEKRLMVELPDHLKPIVNFALNTGLRMSNITNLKWSQVDMDRRQAWIHADESKTNQAIGIPLNQAALTIIREQQGHHREYVFTYQGNRIKNADAKGWRKAVYRAGLGDFHFHDLRHTWATRHIMAGTPLYVLQELGGWSKADTVRKYAHLLAQFLQQHAERIVTSSTNLTQNKN
ncbi:integrase [Arsenophonus sp. ENCA]|uniref:tyrosine-type recombinase/integrase n=1 Tax=Arsenophonus sp. ENCA TaxID=1987579 RepID=UPI000BCEF83C|nr:site-specific integrase [Arsenophonus sp. ENCA]PAV02366.1 integrase [Arsenophonus sp. ENCA]